MGTKTTFRKDPDALLDYAIQWAQWLVGPDGTDDDVIVASTWGAPDGITIEDESFTADTTTVWISGGTVGQIYYLTNHITTANGRQNDQTILVTIVER